MEIEIDPDSEVPLYQQLRDRVVEGIARGDLAPGAGLASVRGLAVDFGINVATVSKGYDMLRQEGLVRTSRRSGTVVARGPGSGPVAAGFLASWRPRLTTLLAEAVAQGMEPAEVRREAHDTLAGLAGGRHDRNATEKDKEGDGT